MTRVGGICYQMAAVIVAVSADKGLHSQNIHSLTDPMLCTLLLKMFPVPVVFSRHFLLWTYVHCH